PRSPSPTWPVQPSSCSRGPSARIATYSHAHGRRGTSPAQHRGPPIGASTKWGRLVQNLSPPGRFKRALAPTAKRTVSRLRGGAGRLRISPTPAGRDNSPVGPVGRPSTKNQVANMKHYVAFPLADRSDTVVAEVVELTDETGHEPAAFPEGVVNKAGEA